MKGVRERILEIVETCVGDILLIEGDISLIDDLGFDSLQLVEVLTKIEEEFQMSFDDGVKMLDMVDHLDMLIGYVEDVCKSIV